MVYKEYGAQNSDVIMLLHGGGLSWWNYRAAAELLEKDFRVILPILDGHAGSDREFTTIEDNAAELIAWIDEHCGGAVLLLGGVSLGGQILLEMLSQRRDICRHALVESALVVPSRLTHALVAPAFGSSYGLIAQPWFAKLQFQSLGIRKDLYEDYYRDTCAITKESMIAFMQANSLYAIKASLGDCTANVHIFVGGKELGAMKTSARRIHEALPGSTLEILEKLYHGEFSINHPSDYVRAVYGMLNGEKRNFLG